MRRALAGTRLRLTMAFAAVLVVAIVVADVALYIALSRIETSAAADVLISQAHTIASGIEDVNGQVRFGSGDLPTETQQGVAVEAAIREQYRFAVRSGWGGCSDSLRVFFYAF